MRIYIGNLPFQTTDEELRSLFEPFGIVDSSQVIKYKKSDRSKGYGFVEMPDESALKAIETLHEKDFNGRELIVKSANPRENYPAKNSNEIDNIRFAID